MVAKITEESLLRLPEVLALIPVSKSTVPRRETWKSAFLTLLPDAS